MRGDKIRTHEDKVQGVIYLKNSSCGSPTLRIGTTQLGKKIKKNSILI